MLETELIPNSKIWHSGVESPEIIENPSVYQWSDEADLKYWEPMLVSEFEGIFG